MFGEEDLIAGQRRVYSVQCESLSGEVILLDKALFFQKLVANANTLTRLNKLSAHKQGLFAERSKNIGTHFSKYAHFMAENRNNQAYMSEANRKKITCRELFEQITQARSNGEGRQPLPSLCRLLFLGGLFTRLLTRALVFFEFPIRALQTQIRSAAITGSRAVVLSLSRSLSFSVAHSACTGLRGGALSLALLLITVLHITPLMFADQESFSAESIKQQVEKMEQTRMLQMKNEPQSSSHHSVKATRGERRKAAAALHKSLNSNFILFPIQVSE